MRATAVSVLACGLLAACIDSGVVECGSLICPAGSACAPSGDRCVAPELIRACDGLSELTPCRALGNLGGCVDGVCATNVCGNAVVDRDEQCEMGAQLGITCLERGFYAAEGLRCNSDCEYDDSLCTGGSCGDGELQPDEEDCDTTPRPGATCVGYGFDRGSLHCGANDCLHDLRDCRRLRFEAFLRGGPHPARDIWGSSDSDVWIVTVQGTIEHYDGVAWSKADVAALQPLELQAIWGFGSDDVYAVGSAIAHWDGSSWTKTELDGVLYDIHGTAPDDVWAVGDDGSNVGIISHYDGSDWQTWTVPVMDHPLSVWADPSAGVLVGGQRTASDALFYWDGVDWTPVPGMERINAIWAAGPSDIFVADQNGGTSTIYHYDGDQWTDIWTDSFVVGRLAGVSGSAVYAAAGTRLLRYNGTQWINLEVAEVATVLAVWASSSGHVFASGNDGRVYQHDGGSFFAAADWSLDFTLTRIYAAATGDAMALGDDRSWARLDGDHWTGVKSGITLDQNIGLWGQAADDIWALSSGALGDLLLQHYDGDIWTDVPAEQGPKPTEGASQGNLWGLTTGELLVAADDVVQIADPDWRLLPMPSLGAVSLSFEDVWADSPTNIWAVANSGTIVHWDGGAEGTIVASAFSTDYPTLSEADFTAVWGTPTGELWVGARTGALFYFDGTNWSEVDAGFVQPVDSISGTSKADVFALSPIRLAHYDGVGWTRVAVPGVAQLLDIWATPEWIAIAGSSPKLILRSDSWQATPP